MKVGIFLPAGYPWERQEVVRNSAQTMGADSLWVVDHFLGTHHPAIWRQMPMAAARTDADAYFDPFCVCAALGPTTELRLGIAVTDATRRAAPDVARGGTDAPAPLQGRLQFRNRLGRGREPRALRLPVRPPRSSH
jgi:phthiodiolone/phenolphthiodiolone dimycocerosates ketoreductase